MGMTDPVLLPTPENPLASVLFRTDGYFAYHPHLLTALYAIIVLLVGINVWQGYAMWRRYQQMTTTEKKATVGRLQSYIKPMLITFVVVSIAYNTIGRVLFPQLFIPIDVSNTTGYIEVIP